MKLSVYSLACMFTGFLFFTTGCEKPMNTVPYNVWVLHSYEKGCPWMKEMNRGIIDGFKDERVKVDLQINYLDAHYSRRQCGDSVLAYMNSMKKPDLILTVNDQATAAVIGTGHPFLEETNGAPVVYCGINYPDSIPLVGPGMSQVSGFTTRVNFEDALALGGIIRRAKLYMPLTYHNIGYIASQKIVSQAEKLSMAVGIKIDTISEYSSYHDMFYKIVEERFQTFGVLPEWDPLAAKFVKTSSTPFIAINNEGFGQGILGGCFTPSYNLAYDGAKHAARMLKQENISNKMQESEKKLLIDWAVYHAFDFPFDRLPNNTEFINIPFSVKYRSQLQITAIVGVFLFTILFVFVFYKVRLYRKQKKENEYKLIQQRDNLLVVTNSINEGIITIDKYGLIRSANSRARLLLQLGENEKNYLNTPFSDWVQIIDQEISTDPEKIFDIILNEKKTISFSPMTRMKCKKTGHYFLANGELVPMVVKGKIDGTICVFSDRTDEFTTSEYLSLTTNVGQLFFWWFDFHKRCLLVDPTFFTKWGIEDDGTHTLPLETFLSFINPKDVKDWYIFYDKQHLSQNFRATREVRMNLNGTIEQYWEVRMAYHLNGEDTLPVLYGLCINIQDYKDKQALLQEARDDVYRSEQLKSAFLSNMSHEIRTPLNGIIGFAKLIASNEEYDAEEYELFINTIQSNCNLLLALINDILDLARIDSDSMVYTDTDCNLNSLIIQVMTTQQVILQKPLQLLRDLPVRPVHLQVDKLRLNQVITNLVNNAVKFTDEGSITVGYTSDDKNVYITVADTGMGIPSEEQSLIFDRFYKKHEDIQGAGIGLSLCKNIVEHYNGTLSVSSQVGKGTTFTVMLPLMEG
ncbi:PAS domain-containing sensor histidine kinase [Parabacteroides segnis]|uniref:ATP-binding protein n=1 Tax=Parabacteroides segnis TaxID=2763058 RepID=UPI003511D487